MLTMINQHVSRHSPQPRYSTRIPRILCVDDDPDFQTSIEMRMRAYDIEVEHAFYGMQGVVEAVNSQPDLVLMDLAMPNGNGEYLLDCIQSHSGTATIPVIVVTGMRDPSLKNRLLRAGAAVFLQKPIHFDELLHHIGRFIDVRKRDADEELV